MNYIKYDENKLLVLNQLIEENLDEVLGEFGVRLSKYGGTLRANCPVHGGDCRTALAIYLSSETEHASWRCYTKKCNTIFGSSMLALVRGILSNTQMGWSEENHTKYNFFKTIEVVCDLLSIKYENIKVDNEAIEKKNSLPLPTNLILKGLIPDSIYEVGRLPPYKTYLMSPQITF